MSVAVTYASTVTVIETLENNVSGLSASGRSITHNAFNTAKTLNAASTPPATKVASFNQALTDGVATIDLTALPGANGAVISGSSLKVQIIKLKAPATNANAISVEPGAANGYDMFGADFKVTLSPGQEVTLYGNDATPDIRRVGLRTRPGRNRNAIARCRDRNGVKKPVSRSEYVR